MQLEINSGDQVRVTSHASIMGDPLLMLWINDKPRGFVTPEAAKELRKVVKDPKKIAIK